MNSALSVKKEVAEHCNRGAEGTEANAKGGWESGTISAEGKGNREGVSPSQQTRGSGGALWGHLIWSALAEN